MGCVYMWTTNINSKGYVGKCHGDVRIRRRQHVNGYGSKLLKRAFDKYGVENFTFEILHDGVFDRLLDEYEIQAIREHNTKVPNGYNLTDGGEGILNPSESTRKKLSEARKRRVIPEETRKKISLSKIGKKRDMKTRKKISESHKGKTVSLEHRQKISQRMKGNQYAKGNKLSAEARKKLSQSKSGRNHPLFGKRHSVEARRKMSESRRGNTNSKGIIKNPYKRDIHDFFHSLPPSLTLSEKLNLLRIEFESVVRYQTLWRWVKQWKSE